MTDIRTIVQRFAEQAGRPDARLLRNSAGNVNPHPYDSHELISYGTHFTLARILLDSDGQRAAWLLNGDLYSVSTSRHQAETRHACRSTGLPVLIVSFSAMDRAGIRRHTVMPLDIAAENYTRLTHRVATLDQVPQVHRDDAVPAEDGDGWVYTTRRHWLGASAFTAEYYDYHYGEGDAVFLSAFDVQETRPHYFLCQLPDHAAPTTLDEAYQALKPPQVVAAEAAGLTVTRQGDLFGVPTTLTTRELTRRGEKTAKGWVLGLNHQATLVVTADDGTTWARGTLYHWPDTGRNAGPRHARRRLGDGRTWHLMVKNTVPTDRHGHNRAWSIGGSID